MVTVRIPRPGPSLLRIHLLLNLGLHYLQLPNPLLVRKAINRSLPLILHPESVSIPRPSLCVPYN